MSAKQERRPPGVARPPSPIKKRGRPKTARQREREALQRLGEKLTVDLAKILGRIVANHIKAAKVIDRELRKPIPNWAAVEGWRKELMTNLDVRNFSSDANDRFGFPRRSASEVQMTGSAPLLVELQLGWPAMAPAEVSDADAPDAGGAGDPEASA